MYNQRRKYTFNGKQFEEIKQPFYYVGLKTKICFKDTPEVEQKFVVLYQEKTQIKPLQYSPKAVRLKFFFPMENIGIWSEVPLVL